MNEIAERIVSLRLCTRKAAMCEKNTKSTLSLRGKLLFLIKKSPLSPQELMNFLCIGKTNLASLTKKMISDSLISKKTGVTDLRQVYYEITEKGQNYLNDILNAIESKFKGIITTSEEKTLAISQMDDVINLLSYL